MLYASASFIFFKFLLAMKAFLTVHGICRLLDMILLKCVAVSESAKLFVLVVSFGTVSITIW